MEEMGGMKDSFKNSMAWITKHRLVCILLVILLVTTICVLVMIDEDCCVDNPQIKIIDGKGENPFQAVREIEIREHGKLVVSISQSLLVTTIVYCSDSGPERSVFYDIWGKRVAECTIRNQKPFSGTVWHLSWGPRGLKQSVIVTYREGNPISTEPYAEEEVSALFKQLGELYSKHAPDLPAISK